MNEIRDTLDQALQIYSQGDFFDRRMHAKEVYFHPIAPLDEENEDYETHMNLFNDWYLFSYISQGLRGPIIYDYMNKAKCNRNIRQALINSFYSLFVVVKASSDKSIVLDLIHGKSYVLSRDKGHLLIFMRGDLLVGRMFTDKDKSLFSEGVFSLPEGVLPVLKKRIVRIASMRDPNQELDFLEHLRLLNVKSKRYRHISAIEIFKG